MTRRLQHSIVLFRGRGCIHFEADPKHVFEILKYFNLNDASKILVVPFVRETKEELAKEDHELSPEVATEFRGLAARANYVSLDRVDIQYTTKEICRDMASPKASSLSKMKRLARYLLGAPRQPIMFQPCVEDFPEMLVYSDSDWAGCLRTRKSTSGGGVDIPGGILKTWSSTQASIAQSSGEAEYYALVRAASEALGMKSIMHDLGWDCKIRLLVDSSAAKSIASRTGLGKLRHLEIKFLWLQECVRMGKVVLSKVRGDINPADVLTKPKSLEDMRSLLNFSCIDWCDSSRPPDTFYSGD